MIIEGFFNLIFGLVSLIIGLFPNVNGASTGEVGAFGEIIGYALYWFPTDLWVVILVNISFWVSIQLGWVVIEWVYKKIPGVD